jgi:hypothetical protein
MSLRAGRCCVSKRASLRQRIEWEWVTRQLSEWINSRALEIQKLQHLTRQNLSDGF